MVGYRSLYLAGVRVASHILAITLLVGMANAQTDPGVRAGTVDAGKALSSVAQDSPQGILKYFNDAQAAFQEVDAVTPNGLGPRFNFNSCAGCHAQPAAGGTSPSANAFPNVGPNPQSQVVALGIVNPATNTIPAFINANGPVREVRFPFFFNSNGTPNTHAPNGGVEDLFTISGRSDAGSCNLAQPPFALAVHTGNIAFRIPTPTFGAGLIENIDDSTLLANQAANAGRLGIAGSFNHNGNDGTISRFGWKAQNKSLAIFTPARLTTWSRALPTNYSRRSAPCQAKTPVPGFPPTAALTLPRKT